MKYRLIIFIGLFIVLPFSVQAEGLTVLGYHRIGQTGRYATTADTFRTQMEFLQEQNYTFLHPGQVAAHLQSKSPFPERSVLLTFDDGHKSIGKIRPYLRKHDIPALFFVYTRALSKQYPNSFTTKTLRDLATSPLFVIGNHTHNHRSLIGYSDTRARRSIQRAQRYIEMEDGLSYRRPFYLSLPYGEYDQQLLAHLSDHYYSPIVFSTAENVVRASDQSPYGRLMINRYTTLNEFKRRVRQRRLALQRISLINGTLIQTPPYYVYFSLKHSPTNYHAINVFLNGQALPGPERINANRGLYRVRLSPQALDDWNQLTIKALDDQSGVYRVRTIGFSMP